MYFIRIKFHLSFCMSNHMIFHFFRRGVLTPTGTGSGGVRGKSRGLPGSSVSPAAPFGWRAGLPRQHIAAACAPRSSRCPQVMGPGEPGTAVLSGPMAGNPVGGPAGAGMPCWRCSSRWAGESFTQQRTIFLLMRQYKTTPTSIMEIAPDDRTIDTFTL